MRLSSPRRFLLAACFSWTTRISTSFQWTPPSFLYGLPLPQHSRPCRSSLARPVHVTEPNAIADPFNACWKADSWTVNAADDEEINQVIRCFNSPAPQVFFALQRALTLVSKNETPSQEQEEVLQTFSYMLKVGYRFTVRDALVSSSRLDWNIQKEDTELETGWTFIETNEDYQTTLEIAHQILDMATEASENHQRMDHEVVESLVDLAQKRLQWTLGTDIRGRTSSDAAFCFAMAGVTNQDLYSTLAIVAKLELIRMSKRPSFQSKSILQIVEKLAAAGLRGLLAKDVYRVAGKYLQQRGEVEEFADALNEFTDGKFGLHSTRPLLWLWRFSARQSKPKKPAKEESLSVLTRATQIPPSNWIDKLDDPSRPLIVDVGSGMGVSLLGLATLDNDGGMQPTNPLSKLDFSNYNFVGGDLSKLLVGYSEGIASRWELSDRVQFACESADNLLDDLETYPGDVAMIMIQFPTPFRLAEKDDGNAQLPSDASSGFMVSLELLRKASHILRKSGGFLLLQSNCEDVAVEMRRMAMDEIGMTCLNVPFPVVYPAIGNNIPQRTLKWVEQGGARAAGPEWSSKPLLPRKGQTETEVACDLNQTPVHRILLQTTTTGYID
jgi:SAM-dependent methyltransferase